MILREIEEWILQTTNNDKKMKEGKILTSHFGCTDIGVFFVLLLFSLETYIVFPLLIGTANYIAVYTKL
jgi:hypothetical protein